MIEKILRFSLYNPIITLSLVLMAAVFGYMKLKDLPIDAVPDITNNQVQINASGLGLSPLEMEKQVTLPLENALAGIPGLETTRSLTRNGFAQITAIFDDAVNIYFARQQITERLAEIKEHFPSQVDVKMGPLSTGLSEIYMWTVSYADTPPEGHTKADYAFLREVEDWIVKPQLQKVKGLAGVDSIGGYVKQYQIEPNLEKLIAFNVSLEDLQDAVQKNHSSRGPGYVNLGAEAFLVRADGRLGNVSDIEETIVAVKNGFPIRVKDVASVTIGTEARFGSATKNGDEVVTGTAMMLIGENARTVARAVDERLQEIKKSLPDGIEITTVLNRSLLVDRTIHTVATNLIEGALLVIAVLFLFLGNFRAALITSCVIPLSLLLTAFGMVEKKISGNLMSLGALDFGLIVDGAVILTENALRRLSNCQTLEQKKEILLSSCKEMIRPSLFGQAIIIIVYIPLLMLTGVEGRMFHPMAWTVIFALISAFILSLTFIPAALSLFLPLKTEDHENRFIAGFKKLYEPILRRSLNSPWSLAGTSAAAIFLAYAVFTHLGQEFVPHLDEKDIALQAMRIPSVSLDTSTSMQRQVENAVKEFPEVAFVFSKTGTAEMASDPMTPNLSDTFVMLKPHAEWPDPRITKEALIEKMEARLFEVPGNNYEFTQPIQLRFNELIGGVKSDLAVKIYGDDLEKMGQAASKIAHVLSKTPGAKDIKVSQTDGLPLLNIQFDRPGLSRYGLTLAQGLNNLEIAVGGGIAGTIYEGDRHFDLVVKISDNNLETLKSLPLKTGNNVFIPLKEVAELTLEEGLNEIKREQGKRFTVVETNVRGRDLGSFVEEAKHSIDKLSLPKGYWIEFGGQFENLISSKEKLKIVIPVSFFLILLLLYSALGSLRNSLIVFTGVPLASVGGILSLALTGLSFSLSAAVGFIALSGIAVLNGLVLLSSIQDKISHSESLDDSIIHGTLERVRPVLMTALVAMLGFVPMALSHAPGAEVQKPLAIVVIGGLFSSTLLTLLVLPALYKLYGKKA